MIKIDRVQPLGNFLSHVKLCNFFSFTSMNSTWLRNDFLSLVCDWVTCTSVRCHPGKGLVSLAQFHLNKPGWIQSGSDSRTVSQCW